VLEKEKRNKYEEGKKKLYSIVERRIKKWNESEIERSKIRKEIDLSPVEYHIYKEELIKSEEKNN
jgi:hypothetical protein